MAKVFVMIGLPGSGKSTYIKNNLSQYPVVSRDIARVELGFCKPGEKYLGSQGEENQVTNYVSEQINKLVNENKDFVLDNTHLKKKYRTVLHKILEGLNYEFNYIVMKTPIEVCIERREKDGFGDLSRQIITSMIDFYEEPTKDEYDNIIFVE